MLVLDMMLYRVILQVKLPASFRHAHVTSSYLVSECKSVTQRLSVSVCDFFFVGHFTPVVAVPRSIFQLSSNGNCEEWCVDGSRLSGAVVY